MKILVAIPCMTTVYTQFFRSVLGLKFPAGDNFVEFTMTENSLVYDARNLMASKAIDNGFDRVLWLDSDMVFDGDLYMRLSAHLDAGAEYVSGLYFKRTGKPWPVVYKQVGLVDKDGEQIPTAIPYLDYPEGLFEIAASGMGACMMTTKLLKDVKDNYGLPFSPVLGFGEDLSFCKRVEQLGRKMYCDSTVKLAHIATRLITEENFNHEKTGQDNTVQV